MQEYIIRRVLYTLLTLFGVATILFFVFRIMPGDPTAQVISPALDEVAQARLKQAYGLDKPLLKVALRFVEDKPATSFELGRKGDLWYARRPGDTAVLRLDASKAEDLHKAFTEL